MAGKADLGQYRSGGGGSGGGGGGEAEIDRFMAAISRTESGGNYNAQNSRTGAYGKFQIMPSNWSAWSKEAGLGANAPRTPENQEKVARFKMLQYYRQFGSWEAVAVAWFAGPGRAQRYVEGDTSVLNISDGNITVGEYVRRAQVGMGKPGTVVGGPAGGGSGGGGGGAGAPPGLPPNASPEQIEAYVRENYPQTAGFLDVPEVRDVLIRAARESWTPSKLQAEIQSTTWWRTTAADVRLYIALKNTDPAEAAVILQRKIDEIEPEIAQLGLEGNIDTRGVAELALMHGWTADQLREHFVHHLGERQGQIGLKEGSTVDLTADELMRLARQDYFVPLNRQDVERWAIDIYAGKRSEEQFRNYVAQVAESRFGNAVAQGISPGEYMAPIRNIIADTLEMNPADVDLLDTRWAEVLQHDPGDGKIRPMTMAEALRYARARPEYKYTNNAMSEASALAEEIGVRFGSVA